MKRKDTVEPLVLDYSRFEADEDPFLKHASLILLQEGCTVAQARFKAWLEGPDGYSVRLEKGYDED